MTVKFEVRKTYNVRQGADWNGEVTVTKRNRSQMLVDEYHRGNGYTRCIYDLRIETINGVETEIGVCGICTVCATLEKL